MKKLFLPLLFSGFFLNAQYLVEEADISDNSPDLAMISVYCDLSNPIEFYRLKCEDPEYAQFAGGENAFKQKLIANLQSYLDSSTYSANGTFELIIYIDKFGKLQRFELKPEVPNSNLLQRDLGLALRSMKPTWIPGKCGKTPVESAFRQKMNFSTEAMDIS